MNSHHWVCSSTPISWQWITFFYFTEKVHALEKETEIQSANEVKVCPSIHLNCRHTRPEINCDNTVTLNPSTHLSSSSVFYSAEPDVSVFFVLVCSGRGGQTDPLPPWSSPQTDQQPERWAGKQRETDHRTAGVRIHFVSVTSSTLLLWWGRDRRRRI